MRMNAHRTSHWIEQSYIPDNIIRKGIRRLISECLIDITANDFEHSSNLKHQFIEDMCKAPISVSAEKFKLNKSEVPAKFYDFLLGNHKKYSCCYWDNKTTTLNQAEVNALHKTCQYAELENGQDILELGCSWGALTLWMAERYPDSQITAITHSHAQKKYIEQYAEKLGISNVEILIFNLNLFETRKKYDRIVSIEMLEHLRNWEQLFKNISTWLHDEGKFYMHIFTHHSVPYLYETKDKNNWMNEHFFTGGMMPCDDLPLFFQDHLKIKNHWIWNGHHYAKTSNAWLKKMDDHKLDLMQLMDKTYGHQHRQSWWMHWRVFFMSCAELFSYGDGLQWHVLHYLFSKRRP